MHIPARRHPEFEQARPNDYMPPLSACLSPAAAPLGLAFFAKVSGRAMDSPSFDGMKAYRQFIEL